MKNNLLMQVFVGTACLQAMEAQHTLNFLIGQTTLRLTKGSVYSVDGKVDLMIIGRHEQRCLQQEGRDHNDFKAGCIFGLDNHMAYVKNQEDDSGSEDDSYKPCENWHSLKDWKKRIQKKEVMSRTYQICEPCIYVNKAYGGKEDYSYLYKRANHDCAQVYHYKEAKGDQAIEEAKKDLAFCYKTVLLPIMIQAKSIALSPLGTQVGFPREEAAWVAISTVIEHIKTYRNDDTKSYDSIHFFVEKRSEFELYKNALTERCELRLRHKIFLLSCIAHHYYEQYSLFLPSEIMHYIWLLWYHC